MSNSIYQTEISATLLSHKYKLNCQLALVYSYRLLAERKRKKKTDDKSYQVEYEGSEERRTMPSNMHNANALSS